MKSNTDSWLNEAIEHHDIWYDIYEDRFVLVGPREYAIHDIILAGCYIYIGVL